MVGIDKTKERELSFHPLSFEEAVADILKVKPEPKPPKKRATKLPKQAVKAQPMLSKK
jgi:hypothetical protein